MRKSRPFVRLLARMLTISLLIGWMGVIFTYSDQPGDESGRTSGHAAQTICKTVNNVFHLNWTEDELMANAERIDYPIRKLAHMTEYGILACFAFFAIIAWPIRGKKLYWLPLLWSFVYAITDEVHQLFVEGRSGKATDVLVDTAGAAIALLIVMLIYKLVMRKRNKNKVY